MSRCSSYGGGDDRSDVPRNPKSRGSVGECTRRGDEESHSDEWPDCDPSTSKLEYAEHGQDLHREVGEDGGPLGPCRSTALGSIGEGLKDEECSSDARGHDERHARLVPLRIVLPNATSPIDPALCHRERLDRPNTKGMPRIGTRTAASARVSAAAPIAAPHAAAFHHVGWS